jgi:hypothetical protein
MPRYLHKHRPLFEIVSDIKDDYKKMPKYVRDTLDDLAQHNEVTDLKIRRDDGSRNTGHIYVQLSLMVLGKYNTEKSEDLKNELRYIHENGRKNMRTEKRIEILRKRICKSINEPII